MEPETGIKDKHVRITKLFQKNCAVSSIQQASCLLYWRYNAYQTVNASDAVQITLRLISITDVLQLLVRVFMHTLSVSSFSRVLDFHLYYLNCEL